MLSSSATRAITNRLQSGSDRRDRAPQCLGLLTLAITGGPTAVLDRVAAIALKLIAETGRPLTDLVSVGVGLPGPVDHSTGRPINPPIMPGWDDADVPGHLGRQLGAPILVDNDVNVMAIGEHSANYPEVAQLLFVKVPPGSEQASSATVRSAAAPKEWLATSDTSPSPVGQT